MAHVSDDDRRHAFTVWLRTGRLPSMPGEDGLELKFNSWHDPANGRFTSAGWAKLPIGTRSALTARRTGRIALESRATAFREGVGEPQQQRVAASIPRAARHAALPVEFARDAAEGLYDTAAGAARGAYSALTTNPATTARNLGRAVAGTIDTAIAAEDVPGRVRISRAAGAVVHASAHDLGRAAGSTVGNVALAVAPGATLSKVSALRRLRAAGSSGAVHDPLKVGWVKERLGLNGPARLYNDTATGARRNYAPTLMRTMPDGSKRPVKFDGTQGEYLIDRKWSVPGKPRAVAQLLRQSDVLAQHRLIGAWEVPHRVQKIKADKLFKKMNVTNIKVRVVTP